MVDPASPAALTAQEVAERYDRAVSTVQDEWLTHPAWPDPIGRRHPGGRAEPWNVYDAGAVDQVVREHFIPGWQPRRKPTDLLDLAAAAGYTGVKPVRIRVDLSRRRWPRPDHVDDDGRRWWLRSTLDTTMASRRPH